MGESGQPKGWWKKRKQRDPSTLHGQKIVTGEDLSEVFDDGGEIENVPGYRRRLFHGVVLTVLAALLITAVLLALAVARGQLTIPFLEPEAEAPVTCPTPVLTYPDNADVSVNVYNATNEGGLAGSVASQLEERGYTVLEVGNRSLNENAATAVIVSGPAGQSAAYNLQRNIPNTEYLEDERTDASVDVVLGRDFATLVPADQVNQEPGQLSCPRLSPEPTPTTSTLGPPVSGD